MRHLLTLNYMMAVVGAGSIRKAAEAVGLTASALTRRIQAFEEEWGIPLFERIHGGVRLTAAGELVIRHIQAQKADVERIKSQIADLSGVRRGHVSIACSQALAPYFLPREIAAYRLQFPAVTFDVRVRDRSAALACLFDYSADLALVFNPLLAKEFEVISFVPQTLLAVMKRDHPLADRPVLRLRDCLKFPVALPDRGFGGRELLEESVAGTSLDLEPAIQSNSFEFLTHYVEQELAVTFQVSVGMPNNWESTRFLGRPIDHRDVAEGHLFLGQLRGRTLPVASARFANQLTLRLEDS